MLAKTTDSPCLTVREQRSELGGGARSVGQGLDEHGLWRAEAIGPT